MGDRLIRGKGREIDEGVAPAAGVSSLGKSRGFFLVSMFTHILHIYA